MTGSVIGFGCLQLHIRFAAQVSRDPLGSKFSEASLAQHDRHASFELLGHSRGCDPVGYFSPQHEVRIGRCGIQSFGLDVVHSLSHADN